MKKVYQFKGKEYSITMKGTLVTVDEGVTTIQAESHSPGNALEAWQKKCKEMENLIKKKRGY